jgi:hypothetical protein
MNSTWLAALIVTGGLAAGCNNYSGEGHQTRQEGQYDTQSSISNQRVATPIQGDTTGGGQRRDARTGGVIDTTTTTGSDRQQINPPPTPIPGGGGATGPASGTPSTGGTR